MKLRNRDGRRMNGFGAKLRMKVGVILRIVTRLNFVRMMMDTFKLLLMTFDESNGSSMMQSCWPDGPLLTSCDGVVPCIELLAHPYLLLIFIQATTNCLLQT